MSRYSSGGRHFHVTINSGEQTTQADTRQLTIVQEALDRALESSDSTLCRTSVEIIAYSSLYPAVKEGLVVDGMLSRLRLLLEKVVADVASLYGLVTILGNITEFMPALTEEQQKMSELTAYAASQKPVKPDPRNEGAAVTRRCSAIVKSGMLASVFSQTSRLSPMTSAMVARICLAVSRDKLSRGALVQQGAIRSLLAICATMISGSKTDDKLKDARRTAAHALARLLVSVNPNHIFGSSVSVHTAIMPLAELTLPGPETEQIDHLPTFEGLLALTNIASMDDDSIRAHLVRSVWPQLDDLLLHKHSMVQRASIELVCNLMAAPEGVALYADGSKEAARRMDIMLALADANDIPTRSAAGGALAMLTEWDTAVRAIMDVSRGVNVLLGMCDESDAPTNHRGIVCIHNLIAAPGKIGQSALEQVMAKDGLLTVQKLLDRADDLAIRDLCQQTMAKLKDASAHASLPGMNG